MNRKIENPFLYVEVSDRGAELMRIMRKDTGAEVLWNAPFGCPGGFPPRQHQIHAGYGTRSPRRRRC